MSLIFRVVYYCSIAWPILDDSEYWVSLVAWMVKHLSTMWKTWVRSLGQEDPLENIIFIIIPVIIISTLSMSSSRNKTEM